MKGFPADRGKRTEIVRSVILPEDLIAEILSWLPVKCLKQFQCVCKYWYNLIANPNFISQHLNNYYSKNPNNGLLLAVTLRYSSVQSRHLRLIAPDGTLPSLPNLPFLKSNILVKRITGPCNGVFCVRFSENLKDGYALWNPAIKEFRILPPLPSNWLNCLPPNLCAIGTHGFGLDPITNDYKLVMIRYFAFHNTPVLPLPFQALMYSLADDSWKHVGDLELQYGFHPDYCYTYLNGKYYWRVSRRYNMFCDVISFDMAKEVFQEMKGPDYCEEGWSLDKFHESLALHNDSIAFYVFKKFNRCLDIWVMDGGCWIKKITAGPFLGVERPIGYWKDGQVLLESGEGKLRSILLCNPSSGEVRDLELKRRCNCAWIGTVIYKDSLVSVSKQRR